MNSGSTCRRSRDFSRNWRKEYSYSANYAVKSIVGEVLRTSHALTKRTVRQLPKMGPGRDEVHRKHLRSMPL
jgi:hypothetical protein